ncbi:MULTISPECIES: putative cytokinetic ring protein SteA [unclassified Paenibacillus]|uniref:putative cytokinetic ring protein SteA n=1 Tax=unclassified Paenibacillus TaxID=185978 RepID=UPI001AEAB56E|nr:MULTISPECIES: putative cytokinetic ring protein SteA [unclassified Paenibacillus]MBP1155154.1 putative membrane-anchored protein [Paenibacillus sp. PvP091]MBP1169462.1 putative membrane-anchored protein [Paenibacillus sp. PvR098]MBP2440490.1 putative membrane-anchored protein [Paenibacillus sp. PvP052]
MKWNRKSERWPIKGKVEADRNTKQLLKRIRPGSIAVISHDDIDELAVRGLLDARVKAVINTGQTMTGMFTNQASLLLIDEGVPLLEAAPESFELFSENAEITLTENGIDMGSSWIPCTRFTRQRWLQSYLAARQAEPDQLRKFIDNTLWYASQEKEWLVEPLPTPTIRTELTGKAALIVVRGSGFKDDLAALRPYIERVNPVLIAVDGGADALYDFGYSPQLIIGDMDSVSDRVLRSGAELIVHGYINGEAPGMNRLHRLRLSGTLLPSGGTSEDAALLLAYDGGCEQIVTVGLHSHMQDFLEKGRKGMGSTWLVRMKVGSKLIDARGISRVYPAKEVAKPMKVIRAWQSFVRSLL